MIDPMVRYFGAKPRQSTHWYKANTVGGGWTADPFFADPGEVERVGLHDCQAQSCKEEHSCNAAEYVQEIALQDLRKTHSRKAKPKATQGRKKLRLRKAAGS